MEQSFFSFKRSALTLAFLLMPAISLYAGPKENKQFLLAMQTCNLKKAEKWIKKGANVDAVDSSGDTALSDAATDGNMDAARFLLENNADINMVNLAGHTALMCAATQGKKRMVELLLERGADIQIRSLLGHTAANYANLHGRYPEIARIIIQAGVKRARIERDNNGSSGTTPAFAKASPGTTPVASPYCTDDEETLSSGSNSTLLFDPEDADEIRDAKGRTELMYAVLKGNYSDVYYLLEGTCDLNIPSKRTGQTPLMYAIKKRLIDIVEVLLEYNANPTQANNTGQTPLMYAADGGDDLIVEKLLESNAKQTINAVDKYGISALTRAVKKGHTEAVQLLLENGAELNPEGQGKWTPIRQAHKKRDETMLQILSDHAIAQNEPDIVREIQILLLKTYGDR